MVPFTFIRFDTCFASCWLLSQRTHTPPQDKSGCKDSLLYKKEIRLRALSSEILFIAERGAKVSTQQPTLKDSATQSSVTVLEDYIHF